MGWMAHRKWKEVKQLPGTAVTGNMLGCCLISFHFLWAIQASTPSTLYSNLSTDSYSMVGTNNTKEFTNMRKR